MRIHLWVLLPLLFLAPVVAAEAAPIAVGDIVTITDGPGTTGGGEFNMFVNGSTQSFVTFCLQRTQYIGFNQQFKVGGVTNYADNAGGNDPISLQTQWLYSNMRAGTLSGYAHTNAMADLLQTAIWYSRTRSTCPTRARTASSRWPTTPSRTGSRAPRMSKCSTCST